MELNQRIERKGKAGAITHYTVCAVLDDKNYVAYRITGDKDNFMKFMIEGWSASTIKEAYPSETGVGSSLNLKGTPKNLEYLEYELQKRSFKTDFDKLCADMVSLEKYQAEVFERNSGKKVPGKVLETVDSDGVITEVLTQIPIADYVENTENPNGDEAIDDDLDDDDIDFSSMPMSMEEAAEDMYYQLVEIIEHFENAKKVPDCIKNARVMLESIDPELE